MNFDITKIIEAVAVLIAAVMSAFVIPLIKSKTTEGQQKQINEWVKIAVVAAEQLRNSGKIKDKKEYVLEFLADNGITVEEESVNALIEAAVYQLKNGVIPT